MHTRHTCSLASGLLALLTITAGPGQVEAQYTPGIAIDGRGPYTNTYVAPWYAPAYDLVLNPWPPSAPRYYPTMMTSINFPGISGAYSRGPVVVEYRGMRAFPDPATWETTRLQAVNPLAVLGTPAYINVRLPADADLWVQGTRTRLVGTNRQFVSPPLNPEMSYGYDVRATWYDNGRPVTQERHVRVGAGDRVTVDFTQPAVLERGTPPEPTPTELRTRPLP